jgi:hypothetical protein
MICGGDTVLSENPRARDSSIKKISLNYPLGNCQKMGLRKRFQIASGRTILALRFRPYCFSPTHWTYHPHLLGMYKSIDKDNVLTAVASCL